MTKQESNDLAISSKLKLLNHYKELPKCSQQIAAKQLNISHGCLRNLLRDESSLQTEEALEQGNERKRQCHGKDEDVEDGLWKWFQFAQSRKIPVSDPFLMQKAEDIAEQIGHNKFKSSEGWLHRWKKWHD